MEISWAHPLRQALGYHQVCLAWLMVAMQYFMDSSHIRCRILMAVLLGMECMVRTAQLNSMV